MHVHIVRSDLAPVSITVLRAALPRQRSFGIEWPTMRRPRRKRAGLARRDVRPARPAPVVQQALPLDRRNPVMTPLMVAIEKILTRIADVGGEMPNNPVLGERAGGRGRSSVDRALRRLATAGRIQIEAKPGRRRVFLVASDSYTDWGEARPGHRPFCRRAKGAPPLPPKPRLPDSQPLPASANTLPRLPSLIGFECALPAVSLAPARQCQWPMWGDDEAPTEQYCGMGSVEGYSFCQKHRDLVFRPSVRRAKAPSCA